MKVIEQLEALHDEMVRRDMYATARDVNNIIDELHAQILPNGHYFEAWRRVALTLGDVHPQWRDEATGPSAVDSAVAAIRSMAAQCSAQPAADERPASTPPLGAIWIDALGYAAGFLHAHDRVAIARELRALGSWLVANAPRT